MTEPSDSFDRCPDCEWVLAERVGVPDEWMCLNRCSKHDLVMESDELHEHVRQLEREAEQAKADNRRTCGGLVGSLFSGLFITCLGLIVLLALLGVIRHMANWALG